MALWEDLVSTVQSKLDEAKQTINGLIPNGLSVDQQIPATAVIPQQEQVQEQTANTSSNDLVKRVMENLPKVNIGEGNFIPQYTEKDIEGQAKSVEAAKNDVTNAVTNYATGAVKGINEMTKAQDALYPGPGQPVPTQEQTQQNQQWVADAQKAFLDETGLPTAAFIPGLTTPAIATMLGNQAVNAYQETNGTPLEKAGNAIRSITYGPAQDMYNNPNLAQEYEDKPITTLVNGALAAGQALLPVIGAKRGINKIVKEYPELPKDIADTVNNERGAIGKGDTYAAEQNQYKTPTEAEILRMAPEELKKVTDEDLATHITNLSHSDSMYPSKAMFDEVKRRKESKEPPRKPHQELVEKVEEQLNPSRNIVKNFYDQTLQPIVEGTVESAKNLKDSISSASVNDHSRTVADTIREHNSENKLAYMQVEKELSEAQKRFAKMNTEQQKQALIDYQEGNMTDPKLKAITDAMKNATGNTWLDLIDMGKNKEFEEWFLPQQWKKSVKNGEILRKWNENMMGAPTGWLNKKVVPSYREGMRLGLEPANTNPVDAILTRETQARRWIMAEKIKAELEAAREIEFIKPGEAIPETDGTKWVAIKGEDNPLGPNSKGVYFARPEAARVINNFLGKGWQDANPYKAWMKVSNTMNQFQLLGGFHVGFTSMDTMVSKATLVPKLAEDAVRNMAKGKFKDVASNIADAVIKTANIPTSPFTTAWKGRNLIKDLLNKDKQNDPMIRAWKAGGGKLGLPEEFTTQYGRSLRKSIANNDFIAAGIKLPFAIAEKMSGLITEKIVPWQKAGVFNELMGYELKKNPELINNHAKLRTEAGRIMDTIDNRLGQVNWDNLFFDPKFKQSMFLAMRAPGWTGGTIREIGGGMLDALNTKSRLAKGDALITHRMAYNIALPLTSLVVNGALQAMLTGNQPDWSKEWKSLMFKYENGTKGDLGETNYSTSPSYMKDIHAWYQDPLGTATNKFHPALSVMAQLYKNKDYFNTQITNPDSSKLDKTIDRAKFVAKQYLPFSIANGMKLNEQGASPVQQGMTFFGLNPAPSDLTATDAQRKVKELMGKMEITKTPDQTEKSQLISKTRHDFASGAIKQRDIVKMVYDGQITEDQAKDIIKHKNTPGLVRGVEHFSIDDAIKVYNVATPEEKAQLKDTIIKKIDTAFHNKNTPPEKKKEYYELFKKIR